MCICKELKTQGNDRSWEESLQTCSCHLISDGTTQVGFVSICKVNKSLEWKLPWKSFCNSKVIIHSKPRLLWAGRMALPWGLLPLFCSAQAERRWSQGGWKFLTLMPGRTSLATFRTMQMKWPNYTFSPNWNDFFTGSSYTWYKLAKYHCNPLGGSCSWTLLTSRCCWNNIRLAHRVQEQMEWGEGCSCKLPAQR